MVAQEDRPRGWSLYPSNTNDRLKITATISVFKACHPLRSNSSGPFLDLIVLIKSSPLNAEQRFANRNSWFKFQKSHPNVLVGKKHKTKGRNWFFEDEFHLFISQSMLLAGSRILWLNGDCSWRTGSFAISWGWTWKTCMLTSRSRRWPFSSSCSSRILVTTHKGSQKFTFFVAIRLCWNGGNTVCF